MAHAVERLFFVAAEKAGYSWVKVAQPNLSERQYTIKQISSPEELRNFVAGQSRILAPVSLVLREPEDLVGDPF